MTSDPTILRFNDPGVSLELAGGKGANLARLSQAGLRVPPGFILTTSAYHAYCAENGLAERIAAALHGVNVTDPQALELASEAIRAAFAGGRIPPEVREQVLAAWGELGAGACAVRSSATAEDLPGISFAGQQDTYLNIRGVEALLDAVVRCWGSLWTARAIGYRARQGIPTDGLGLAVVVQRMVESEVSGVMFTANPLSGLRGEVVIDAAFGLGEALVSGQVEPDHYIFHLDNSLEKRLGEKALSLHSAPAGGLNPRTNNRSSLQALADEHILELAGLGRAIESLYGEPQDIEWALAEDKLHVLQSRPITSLYPLPVRADDGQLHVYFAFSAIQGMPLAMTPLGMYLIRDAFAVGAGMFGMKRNADTQGVLREAGYRLWSDTTSLVRSPLGRKVVPAVLSYVEPSFREIILTIWDDQRLLPTAKHARPATAFRLARFFLPMMLNMVSLMLSPVRQVRRRKEMIEQRVNHLVERIARIPDDPTARLNTAITLTRELVTTLPPVLRSLIPCVAAGMAAYNGLYQLSRRLPPESLPDGLDGGELAVKVTRGMPGNTTTEMDLALWQTALAIRADAPSLLVLQTEEADELARRLQAGQLPAAAMAAVSAFLERYGMRGLGEIDMGRPRWQDDPRHVFEVLGSYLGIEDEHLAPQAVFERSAVEAEAAVEVLAAAAKHTRGGWLRSRLIRFFARRARAIMGVRESPKFFIIRMTGHLRALLLRCGSDLAAEGVLAQAEDIVFLNYAEMEQIAAGQRAGWQALITARKAGYEREMARRLLPRVMLSDGRTFYEGLANRAEDGPNHLTGSPVSPGLVEAPVRVVLDPRNAGLLPGEIMVCHGTDPAWTPLFLAASGLIMEVGGMMTHGGVVAREYGIPAVVGVDRAVERLKTGQRVRLDGSSGQIEIIEA